MTTRIGSSESERCASAPGRLAGLERAGAAAGGVSQSQWAGVTLVGGNDSDLPDGIPSTATNGLVARPATGRGRRCFAAHAPYWVIEPGLVEVLQEGLGRTGGSPWLEKGNLFKAGQCSRVCARHGSLPRLWAAGATVRTRSVCAASVIAVCHSEEPGADVRHSKSAGALRPARAPPAGGLEGACFDVRG